MCSRRCARRKQLNIRLKELGEAAHAAPKGKREKTLRQKDQLWTKLWKAASRLAGAPKK